MFKQIKSTKNKIILVSLICIVLIVSTFCISFLLQASKKEQLGNTSGNIANLGTMVKHKDKIYYTNYKKIMVMDSTGKNQKEVCSGNYYMLSSYGDYIYFVDGDDQLYKIKPEDNKVIPINPDKSYFNYIILNDYIYYTDAFSGNLYKTDIDCKEHHLISEGEYGALVANGDWIYTTSLGFNNNKINRNIYRVSMDGKQKEEIGGDNSSPMLTNYLNISGDWIYFVDGNKNICKMNLDGSDKVVICKDKCGYINVYDGWIYYSDLAIDSNLYKIRTDGTDRILVCDNKSSNINVSDNIIIFHEDLEQKLYMIKTDGTERTEL